MIWLAKSFRESDYPRVITVDRQTITPIDWEMQMIQIENHLRFHDISDYFVFSNKNVTTFYFKTKRDQMLAHAKIYPDRSAEFEFTEIKHLSDEERKVMAQKFHHIFTEKGMLKNHFDIVTYDGDYHLYAVANSGPDLVTLMRWSEQLKAAFGHP